MRSRAILPVLVLLLGPLLPALALFHVPHDGVFSVAVAALPGGVTEILVASNDPTHVMRSRDDGLTWESLSGQGLERVLATKVAWWPAGGSAGQGLFLIGTEGGIWAYDPHSGAVVKASNGIPDNQGKIFALATPLAGSDGPAVAINRQGRVFRLDPGANAWVAVYDFGHSVLLGAAQVAIAPHFDSTAPAGPDRAITAAINGVLHRSDDGGATWTVHPQFNLAAQSAQDWLVTSLAFAEDYAISGQLLVGRGRENPLKPGEDEGELWRSADFGGSFVRVLALKSAVAAIGATPPGPSGQRHFFLGSFTYPDTAHFRNVGVLRSADGGLSWDDFGNEQDFSWIARGVNRFTGLGIASRVHQAFAASPDYGSDGALLYARPEGLFQSRDEGVHWLTKRTREEQEVRCLDSTIDGGGNLLAFTGTYGGSVQLYDFTNGFVQPLRRNAPMAYLRRLATSPAFADDGNVIFAGSTSVDAWYDPQLRPPANPFGEFEWVDLPLIDTQGGPSFDGIPRAFALSPHYDGRGGAGADLAIYWDSFEDVPMRSRDGGVSMERIGLDVNGQPVEQFVSMAIAPTYDDTSAAGRTDVYAGSATGLYRLEDDRWRLIHNFGTTVSSIEIDPTWSRPGNPRLFVALLDGPHVAALVDDPAGATVSALGAGISDLRLRDIAVPPDFAVRPYLYVLSWGLGPYSLDLATPGAVWQPVGGPWPRTRTEEMDFSPDFANDRRVFVGTGNGLAVGRDQVGANWEIYASESFRDDRDEGFVPFQPNDPANPQPDRPWKWLQGNTVNFDPALDITDRTVRITTSNGAYLLTSGIAKTVKVHTFKHPRAGSVRISAFEYGTGNLLGAILVDLQSGGQIAARTVTLQLSATARIDVKVEAVLGSRQAFAFDGLSLERP
ncbi:MAG TPA: hypothetical protein VGC54_14950 [Planctomycetota bacterium]